MLLRSDVLKNNFKGSFQGVSLKIREGVHVCEIG